MKLKLIFFFFFYFFFFFFFFFFFLNSTFGLAFQNTAQRTNARVKHDSFDASVIEVKKEDLKTFIESLQSSVILNDDYI